MLGAVVFCRVIVQKNFLHVFLSQKEKVPLPVFFFFFNSFYQVDKTRKKFEKKNIFRRKIFHRHSTGLCPC